MPNNDETAMHYISEAKNLITNLNILINDQSNRFNKEQIAKLTPKFSEIMGTIGQMAVRMGSLEGEIKSYKMIMSNQPAQSQSNFNQNNFIEAISEMEERRERSKNVVVFNIPESKAPTMAQRIEEDTKSTAQMINRIEPIANSDILRIYRLGTSREGACRPIKVELRDFSQAKRLLKSKSTLPNGLKLKQDLTLKQRAYLTDLRNELESRMKSGEVNLTIKYINSLPKIVSTLPKNSTNSQDVNATIMGH